MHVRHPRHHKGYGDEDHDGQVDSEVAWYWVCSRGKEDEAHRRDETEETDERSPNAQLVCCEVDSQDYKEAE